MAHKFSTSHIEDSLSLFRYYKKLAEGAIEQVSDEELFTAFDEEMNSIAIIVKHMAGNMRSRWTDFLTADGEKPNRNRDSEFESESRDTRASVTAVWNHAWDLTIRTIETLTPDDLMKKVTIRSDTPTVIEAIHRQLMHYAEHVGQIIFLAKHYAGANWRTLSVPKKPRA